MFSGIVECVCPVIAAGAASGTWRLTLDLSPLRALDAGVAVSRGTRSATGGVTHAAVSQASATPLLELGASLSVNGCCLTAAALDGDRADFDVVAESLARTNLGALRAGSRVNVERSLRYGERVDGHLVSGHVEATGLVTALDERPGDTRLAVRCGAEFVQLLLPKGSVAIDGVSLTLAALGADSLQVALVPHTLERTTLGERRPGDRVNLEPDLIGRWVLAAVERQRG